MFQAFIDDSGWDGKSPVFVLAGYVASEKQWESFASDWQAVLDLQQPKKLLSFKMNEARQFRHTHSQFYGFSEAERDERLIKLVKVINKHTEHGIISVIPLEPYARFFRGKFNPSALDRPYFLSFFGVMTRLIALAKQRNVDDGIEFIFDTQGGESRALLEAEYARFISVAPPGLKELAPPIPKFGDDRIFTPLQAADMIAWHARRYYYDLAMGKDPQTDTSHVFLANLFLPQHDILELWTEETIRGAAEVIGRRALGFDRAPIAMTIPDPSSPLNWQKI
jgi:hypothetical protein